MLYPPTPHHLRRRDRRTLHGGSAPARVEPLEGRLLLSAVHPAVRASAEPVVVGLTLVDADRDRDLRPLADGGVIDLASDGTGLSVRADAAGDVGSVRFALDGATFRVEGSAPYTIANNVGNDYLPWTPAAGAHTLVVTPYAGPAGTGLAGAAVTVHFTVVGQSPTPTPTPAPTAVSWRAVAANPLARTEAVGATVGGKLYVFGGFNGDTPEGSGHWTARRRGDAYDPATNKWTRVADMPEPFSHASGTVVGTVIWFVGGYVGNHPGPATTHVWKYDTVANAWSRGPDLPVARGAGAAALVGNKIYFAGGMEVTRTVSKRDLFVLDLNDQAAGWGAKRSVPTARNHTAAVALGGKLYLVGGQLGQEAGQVPLATVEAYDPATDTWSARASLPHPRGHITAGTIVVGGRILVLGGEQGYNSPQRTVYAYDPAANRWSSAGSMPAARSTVVAGVLPDGRVVMSTGNSPTWSSQTWVGTLA